MRRKMMHDRPRSAIFRRDARDAQRGIKTLQVMSLMRRFDTASATLQRYKICRSDSWVIPLTNFPTLRPCT